MALIGEPVWHQETGKWSLGKQNVISVPAPFEMYLTGWCAVDCAGSGLRAMPTPALDRSAHQTLAVPSTLIIVPSRLDQSVHDAYSTWCHVLEFEICLECATDSVGTVFLVDNFDVSVWAHST